MFGIVYEVRNLVNGKRYIGLTRFSAEKRWREHVSAALRRPKSHLHCAISKYGAENFKVTEIASSIKLDFLSELERVIITQERPEYNQTCGGEVTFGRKYSDEVKETIRRKNTGKKRSDECKKKISEIKLQQYKDNPSLSRRSSDWLRANRHKWEEKRIEASRRSATGRKMTDQHKEMLREISKTRIRTPEENALRALSKTKRVRCETDGKVYHSRHEAANAYGVSEKTIWRACNGKCGPVKGLVFSYTGKTQ